MKLGKSDSNPQGPRWLIELGLVSGDNLRTANTEEELAEVIRDWRRHDIGVKVYEIGAEVAYAYVPPTVVVAKKSG